MTPADKIIAELRKWGSLTDDVIAGLTQLSPAVELRVRRALRRRGLVRRVKVRGGRMAWRVTT